MSDELKRLIEEQEWINRIHTATIYNSERKWTKIVGDKWQENSEKIKKLIETQGL